MRRNRVCLHVIKYLGESKETKTIALNTESNFGGVVHNINI